MMQQRDKSGEAKKKWITNIQEKIITWYVREGRKGLPWRKTTDLYRIAVAEIMLQQTNVPKVIEKYQEFLQIFPTVRKLAEASQSDVITQWRGLGYNRRALYLHRMAQEIVEKFDTRFPSEPADLVQLRGIGQYTSKSIPIFACNADLATHDVNIARIMCRIHRKNSSDNEQITQWVEKFLPQGRSRDWHNALMDFASMICTKRSPLCDRCPIGQECRSYPCPQDEVVTKKKEVGRTEDGKHVPRRIYRGRIVEYLRTHSGTVDDIGPVIKRDWQKRRDRSWCMDVLRGLEKDHMIVEDAGVWKLR